MRMYVDCWKFQLDHTFTEIAAYDFVITMSCKVAKNYLRQASRL